MKAPLPHFALAFTGGFVTMAVEMIAARALAPFFGTSAFIWATVIAVVMGLIFIGNLMGGRLADRGYSLEKLCYVQLIAALLIPLFSHPVILLLYAGFHKLPESWFIIGTAMILSVLVISSPVLLLACISPWLIGILSDGQTGAGGIAGRIYSVSTLGGLTGTFVPVLVLVPLIGIRLSFTIISLYLSLCAAGILFLCGRRKKALILIVCVGLSNTLIFAPANRPHGIVFQDESVYNSIWVRDNERCVDLMVNERKAIQSRLYRDASVLPHDVWGMYLTAPMFAEAKADKKILFLGLGGGSAAHYFSRYFPEYEMWGVEIDGAIINVARRHFNIDEVPLQVINTDARLYLTRTDIRFDVIIVDAYSFPYLPGHLSTVEFMRLLRERLHFGGVVLYNVGHDRSFTGTVDVISQTGLAVFDNAYAYRHANKMNTLVYFSDHLIDGISGDQHRRDAKLLRLTAKVAQRLERLRPTPTSISTDDRPLSEWVTNRIVLQAMGILK